jgi:Ser/Thr protein kinase RdoA (MazF antagonist)
MTTEPVQRKLHFVLEKYGIRPVKNFTFSYFSMANEVFFLQDTNNRRLVLKNCLKNRSRVLLEAEIKLAAHLNANGCGAPEAVPAADGNPIVEMDGDFYLMTKHMKGHMPLWNKGLKDWHYRGAITGLAKYHRAVSSLDPSIDTDRIKTCEYERTLEWTERLASDLEADASGRQSVDKMRSIIGAYLDLARRLREYLPPKEAARCETLMVHGDFHAFNVVYRRKRFHACYDFDFIRRDLKIFDIVWTLGFVQRRFYFRRYGAKMRDDAFMPDLEGVKQVELDSLRWFVRIYRKTWKLSQTEIRLLPGMQAAMALYNLRFFSLAHSEEECMEHFGWYDWILKGLTFYEIPRKNAARLVSAEAEK